MRRAKGLMFKGIIAAGTALLTVGSAYAQMHTAALGAPTPAWMPHAKACVAQYERIYHTLGDWVYQAAACTALTYPPTSQIPHQQVQFCANKVYRETYNLCQACGPDRITAVMGCLGAH